LAFESVAVTVWLPLLEDGTVKVAVNVPPELVVTVAGLVVNVAASNCNVNGLEFGNPDPVTVTAVPTAPPPGLSAMAAAGPESA